MLDTMKGDAPSSRNCHSSTTFGKLLVIFGGREGDGRKKILNDIFILDTEKEEWIQPEIIGDHPLPRMGHTAQLYDTRIVIHGGWNGFKVMDDIVYIEVQSCKKKVKCYSLPSLSLIHI